MKSKKQQCDFLNEIKGALKKNSNLKLTPPIEVTSPRNEDFDITVLELARALRSNADALYELTKKLSEHLPITIKDCLIIGGAPAFQFKNEPNVWEQTKE